MGNRAWDMITVRNEMQDAMKPQYASFKSSFIDPMQSKFADYSGSLSGLSSAADSLNSDYAKPLRDQMYGMMTDESKRGYSDKTKNQMFGRQADALTGAKTSYMRNMGKTLASQGLGGASSGARMRNLNEYENQHASNLRAAGRDVELADAEAKRADLWSAVQGFGKAGDLASNATSQKINAASLGLDALKGEASLGSLQLQNLGQQQDLYNSMEQASQAYSGVKNSESGFWKSFKNSLGSSLGNSLGSFGYSSKGGYSFGG